MDNHAWLIPLAVGQMTAVTMNYGQIAPWSIGDMQAKRVETRDSVLRMHQVMDRKEAE